MDSLMDTISANPVLAGIFWLVWVPGAFVVSIYAYRRGYSIRHTFAAAIILSPIVPFLYLRRLPKRPAGSGEIQVSSIFGFIIIIGFLAFLIAVPFLLA